jgi:hypothetical protein
MICHIVGLNEIDGERIVFFLEWGLLAYASVRIFAKF